MQQTTKEVKKFSSKNNFSLKSENTTYDFTLINKEDELTFKFEDLKEFPVKIYELKIEFAKLKELDDNFFMFKTSERFIDVIKACIQSDNYSVKYESEENIVIFEIKNIIFTNGGAKIKIPEKEQDLKSQVEALTKIISEMKKENTEIKLKKEEAAIKSFANTSILENEHKKLISEWIDPKKIIKFNMLFNTSKDGDSSSTFHYNCDGVFPTVTVICDTSGRKFGGYSTQNWCQSTIGAYYSRAPGSFIFNLTNKQKFDLIDQYNTNAVYRHNSYGPVFGAGYDIYLANQCKSNGSSYCNKSSYNTGNTNLLGGNGSTSFQVSYYEVYQVVFE